MDTKTFANSIRTKYPDGVTNDGKKYSELSDQELTSRVVDKYPVYRSKITDYTPYQAPGFFGRVGEKIVKGQQEINNEYQTKDAGIQMREDAGAQGKASSAWQKATAAAKGGVESAIVNPVSSFLSELVSTGRAAQKKADDEAIANGTLLPSEAISNHPHIEDQLSGFLGHVMTKLKENRAQNKEKGGGPDLIDMYEGLSPATKANIQGGVDLGSAAFDTATALEGGNIIKKGAKKVMESIPGAAEATVDAAKGAVDTAKTLKTKVGKIGKDRTSEELAKLTEADMPKMSASERQEFTRIKKEEVNTAAKKAQMEADKKLASDIEVSKNEIKQLQKDVGNVSAAKTEELKPKVIEGIKRQSETYEKIVDEELAPVRDTMVTPSELKSFINKNINPNDPASVAKAQKIIETLGLAEQDAKAMTVGDIYNNAKAFKQEISKASKSGSKVFSPEEMQVMDSVSTLSDFLKEKGVDLTRANDFWKSWAPVRDQLITKMRPFDVTGTKGGGFAKTLQRVAEDKTDTFNKNFIQQVETLVGEPITGETKAAVEKLTAAQKAKVAKEYAAQEAKLEAKIAKDKTLSALSKEAYDAKVSGMRKELAKKIGAYILGIAGVGGAVKGAYDLISQ